MITAEKLREVLDYDPETGVFIRRVKSRGARIGAVAGSLSKSTGYQVIHIGNKTYKAHRLAWLHVYGEWPEQQIDHINGIRTDNRISNLRAVSNRQNAGNRIEHRTGKLPGATYHKRDKLWCAYIQVNGKQIHLGYHQTEQQAYTAWLHATAALTAVSNALSATTSLSDLSAASQTLIDKAESFTSP